MKKKTTIVICALFIILNTLLFFCSITLIKSYEKKIKTIENQKEQSEKVSDYKKENIVFLGDSITDWCPFEALYEDNIPIINSGRAGYRTKDILNELDKLVYQYNPTKVIILIGTNDIGGKVPDEEIIKNIKQIIVDIKKNRNRAKIYVQSIYPINNTDTDKINKKNVGDRTNSDIKRINKKIKKICKEENVNYINVYDELTDSKGDLNLQYTEDGLHISGMGYLKITRKLLPYIEN